ncbi:MAG: hypothetical protein AB1896_22135, partial [Thermodesulfobacteriota bacterium]
MCGISGLILKGADSLGRDLINMLKEMVHRGRDATGVALYENRETVVVRVSMSDPKWLPDLERIIAGYGPVTGSRGYQGEGVFTFFEGSVEMDEAQVPKLYWDIDSHPELCVHSLG